MMGRFTGMKEDGGRRHKEGGRRKKKVEGSRGHRRGKKRRGEEIGEEVRRRVASRGSCPLLICYVNIFLYSLFFFAFSLIHTGLTDSIPAAS